MDKAFLNTLRTYHTLHPPAAPRRCPIIDFVEFTTTLSAASPKA
ncbi:hypothetical protein EVA_09148 [gut metagenome]|uniref:Uncharacterized protein n=1 Tax=gut metagenome TaxID=749906 RepID=J9G794_9ZZZZ